MSSRLQVLPAIKAHAPFTIRMSGETVPRSPAEGALPPEPWNRNHFTALATAQLLVVALLIGAWMAVSDQLVFTRQVPQLDLAVIATMAGGVANVLWIAHGRAAVRRRKANFLRQVGVVLPATLAANAERAASTATIGAGLEFVTTARMTRYHRPDCPLVDGKSVHPFTSPDDTDRRPCGLCRPTGSSASAAEVDRA